VSWATAALPGRVVLYQSNKHYERRKVPENGVIKQWLWGSFSMRGDAGSVMITTRGKGIGGVPRET